MTLSSVCRHRGAPSVSSRRHGDAQAHPGRALENLERSEVPWLEAWDATRAIREGLEELVWVGLGSGVCKSTFYMPWVRADPTDYPSEEDQQRRVL